MPCDRPRSEARFERVVVRASGGDQAAVDELVEVLRPRLALYCRRVLRDADRLPEVLQATLDDVVSALPGMRERRAPFPSWAYGLAARRVRAANGEGDVDAARDLISRLSERERAIVARYAQGRALEQIAVSLDLSRGRARVLLHRALSKLRRVPGGAQSTATVKIVGELLREGDGAGIRPPGGEEDGGEDGELDLRAARTALLADLRATLGNHDVVSTLDRADAEVRTEATTASSALRGGAPG